MRKSQCNSKMKNLHTKKKRKHFEITVRYDYVEKYLKKKLQTKQSQFYRKKDGGFSVLLSVLPTPYCVSIIITLLSGDKRD